MSTMSTNQRPAVSSAQNDVVSSFLKLLKMISVTDLDFESAKEGNGIFAKSLKDPSSYVRRKIDEIQSGIEGLTKSLVYPMAPLKSTRMERLLMEQNVIVNHALFRFRVDYRRDELVISLKHRINDAFVTMGFGEIPTSRMLLLSRGPESTIFEPNWKLIWDFTHKG